jgi:hypothetical protein
MSADKENGSKKFSQEVQQQITSRIIFGTGYGNPPAEHRFKKGAPSPNPKGRPRKAPPDLGLTEQPMLAAVLKGTDKKITMRDGGKTTEVSVREGLVQAVIANALKGNARSQGLLGDWVRTADAVKAREVRQSNEYWRAYQLAAREILAEAKARGESEPTVLPHPDDIVLDDVAGAPHYRTVRPGKCNPDAEHGRFSSRSHSAGGPGRKVHAGTEGWRSTPWAGSGLRICNAHEPSFTT